MLFLLRNRRITSCNGLNCVLLSSGKKKKCLWLVSISGVSGGWKAIYIHTFLCEWYIMWWSSIELFLFFYFFFLSASSLYVFWAIVGFAAKVTKVNPFLVLDWICTFSKMRRYFLPLIFLFFFPAWKQNTSCTAMKSRCCFVGFFYVDNRKTGENKMRTICHDSKQVKKK